MTPPRFAPTLPFQGGLRPLALRLSAEIDRTALADIVEMLAQEIARRLAAAAEQRFEKFEIRIELGACREIPERRVERNAVQVDAAVLAFAGAVRQAALVDQARDEIDRAEFREQRGIERDLVHPVHDLGVR